jgi:hypothetical protein
MARPDVEAALAAIAARNRGRLTPQEVVDEARPPNSVLHSFFTWNTRKAAQERLLDQARTLIASVRLEVITTKYTLKAPAYIRDPVQPAKEAGYVSTGTLRTDVDRARDACVQEFRLVVAALRRAQAVAAVLGLSGQVETIQADVSLFLEHIVHPEARA